MNTASVAGLVAAPFMGPYNAAKHGVVAISETLYHELAMVAPHVKVSVLCPGWVNTNIADSERNRPAHLIADDDDDTRRARRGAAILQRVLAAGMAPDERRGQGGRRDSRASSSGSSRTTTPADFWVDAVNRRRSTPLQENPNPASSASAVERIPCRARSSGATRRVRIARPARAAGSGPVSRLRDVDELCDAITTLAVRGAPALGAAGALRRRARGAHAAHKPQVRAAAGRIATTRPTAVNLAWGVERALAAYEARRARRRARRGGSSSRRRRRAQPRARRARRGARSRRRRGADALQHGRARVRRLRHRARRDPRRGTRRGTRPRVWVDETRPLLQGARLTMWELDRLGIDATLVPDGAAASLMAAGEVDVVIVGADRIAANGDVANKIGTYALAVLARHHGCPFYVAAPTSTIDLATPDGDEITIEERDARRGHAHRAVDAAAPPARRGLRTPRSTSRPAAPRHCDHHRGRRRPAALPPLHPRPCPPRQPVTANLASDVRTCVRARQLVSQRARTVRACCVPWSPTSSRCCCRRSVPAAAGGRRRLRGVCRHAATAARPRRRRPDRLVGVRVRVRRRRPRARGPRAKYRNERAAFACASLAAVVAALCTSARPVDVVTWVPASPRVDARARRRSRRSCSPGVAHGTGTVRYDRLLIRAPGPAQTGRDALGSRRRAHACTPSRTAGSGHGARRRRRRDHRRLTRRGRARPAARAGASSVFAATLARTRRPGDGVQSAAYTFPTAAEPRMA